MHKDTKEDWRESLEVKKPSRARLGSTLRSGREAKTTFRLRLRSCRRFC